MNTCKNQRFQETEQRIKSTLLALLEEKEFAKITIGHICARCGINRSSFYLHFLDIYDLMDHIQRDIYQDMVLSFQDAAYDADHFIRREYLVLILDHVRRNQVFYRAYFSSHHASMDTAANLLYQNIVHPMFLRMECHPLSKEQQRKMKYHFHYFWDGFIGVMRLWLKNQCPESAEELGGIIWQSMNLPEDIDVLLQSGKTCEGSCPEKSC